jgi:hypothetical protein
MRVIANIKTGIGILKQNRIEVANEKVVGGEGKARNRKRVTKRNGGLGKIWSKASSH